MSGSPDLVILLVSCIGRVFVYHCL